jgi:UDP-N-acetylglucosamine acyltransferase
MNRLKRQISILFSKKTESRILRNQFENNIDFRSTISSEVDIGTNNHFYPYSVIGQDSQMHGKDKALVSENLKRVIIGNNNIFREFTTVHLPAEEITSIGNGNIFMCYSHVPHDARIGNFNKFTNSVQLGGFAVISDYCYFGLNSSVQQRLTIGSYVTVGMNTSVAINVPPFTIVMGNSGQVVDTNNRALRKVGCTNSEIKYLKSHVLSSGKMEIPEINNKTVVNAWKEFQILLR